MSTPEPAILYAQQFAASSRRSLVGAMMVCLLASVYVVPAWAQGDKSIESATGTTAAAAPAQDRRKARQSELDRVARDIKVNAERQAALEREIKSLEKDRATLNGAILAAAQKARRLEDVVEDTATRLARLGDDESRVRASFDKRQGLLADLLGALQKMGSKPPPVILVRPDDALAAVRSAILVGAVVPQVKLETDILAADLEELAALRHQTDRTRMKLTAELTALAEERKRVELLVSQKQRQAKRSRHTLAEEKAKAADLAAKAQSLKELIAGLEAEIGSVKAAAEKAAAADASKPPSVSTASRTEKLAMLDNPKRITPAVPFGQAKGILPKPAHGVQMRSFGEKDDFGTPSKGLSIATRVGAGVNAPCDGWVVYAGPFRSYGQLLIINAGGGYHVLLAGMNKIDVELGQFVLTGEPVATMGTRHFASATTLSVGSSQPVLYVEFRKDGTSIDPGPWWARPT